MGYRFHPLAGGTKIPMWQSVAKKKKKKERKKGPISTLINIFHMHFKEQELQSVIKRVQAEIWGKELQNGQHKCESHFPLTPGVSISYREPEFAGRREEGRNKEVARVMLLFIYSFSFYRKMQIKTAGWSIRQASLSHLHTRQLKGPKEGRVPSHLPTFILAHFCLCKSKQVKTIQL